MATDAELSLLVPDWPAPANVRVVMSTRSGGVSAAPYDALNLAMHTEDDPARVAVNRDRFRDAAGFPEAPLWLSQVHGTRVLHATGTSPVDPPVADGSWTDTAGVACAVLCADCMPVVLTRSDGSAVAALHAGWRGLAAGILDTGVAALADDSSGLLAWLGPRIGPQAFRVGADVRAAFDRPADGAAFVRDGADHWFADLGMLATLRLERAGVRVFDSRLCTVRDPKRFFSYRRDGACGRMAAVIWRAE